MTVLCATDFSLCARSAVDVAAAVARRLGDSLQLLHVLEPALLAVPEAGVAAGSWIPQLTGLAERQLLALQQDLEKQGLAVDCQVRTGTAASTIVQAAQACAPRLLVLGTHGRQGAMRMLLGSVAAGVVAHASVPVLVVRPGVDASHWGRDRLRLVAGLDGSDASEAALAWLRTESGALGDVTAVRLYWPPQEARRYGLQEPWLGADGHPRLRRTVDRDLRHRLGDLGKNAGCRLHLRVASIEPVQQLLDEVRREAADMVVVGVARHGPTAWNALVAKELLSACALPVLCVPQPEKPAVGAIPPVRSVLVATDLSPGSNAAVPHALALLPDQGGRIELCHVHERGRSGPSDQLPLLPALSQQEKAALEARLRSLLPANGRARGIASRVSVIEGDLAPESIAQAAERLDVDMIVLASHGRSGWKRAVLGSVAEQVARQATRPVLLVRDASQHEGGTS